MDEGENYAVKDLSLAGQGFLNIEYAESQMAALMKVKARFEREKPLKGLRIGMALHPSKETAVLVRTLAAGGAEVALCACNPLSTQDDVVAALSKEGVSVWAYKGESKEDYYKFLRKVIETKPHITIDDGCDLVSEIHRNYPQLIKDLIGGCEETTTGIIRLRAMEKDGALKYPIIAVNDNKTKHLFDNFYGTGQSTIDGILRATNILFAGKTVVVCGYGDCGKGVAMRAKGLGADVIVTEVNAFRALQAKYDGYRVMPIEDASREGDIFITVTGDKSVIRPAHMERMKDGAMLFNSGHFDAEIDIKGLNAIATKVRRIRPYLDEYTLKSGRKLYVGGEGRLINLVAAEGHPSAVMSTSFCGQSLAVEFLVKNRGRLKAGVITLPEQLDDEIAALQLEALGIFIDTLTEEQKKYLSEWQEGT
ncbi:adenosylhomocysteinase [Candidatus Woesearchaeota archaeon]|nr:adenosylhomocysteinase [Candidatus Woesearchaeota archaeon]